MVCGGSSELAEAVDGDFLMNEKSVAYFVYFGGGGPSSFPTRRSAITTSYHTLVLVREKPHTLVVLVMTFNVESQLLNWKDPSAVHTVLMSVRSQDSLLTNLCKHW